MFLRKKIKSLKITLGSKLYFSLLASKRSVTIETCRPVRLTNLLFHSAQLLKILNLFYELKRNWDYLTVKKLFLQLYDKISLKPKKTNTASLLSTRSKDILRPVPRMQWFTAYRNRPGFFLNIPTFCCVLYSNGENVLLPRKKKLLKKILIIMLLYPTKEATMTWEFH